MTGQIGDRVVVEPKGVDQPGRVGVIEEVLQEEPARYRVRWDDGHTSIIVPASGSIRIETAKVKAPRKKTGARAG
jgi:Domain of unknown function (DUF1918)